MDCWSLGSLYQTAASRQDEVGNATAARVFGLLSAIVQIHFKPEDRSEPYGPQFVMDTIQALRRLPNTRERRQELEVKLRRAQASVRDQMGVTSTQFDLTEFIKHARQCVSGVSLPQALGQFADLADLVRSPDPDALRDEARRVAEEHPLSSIMPSTMVDEDGKVIAKSPGMLGDQRDSDISSVVYSASQPSGWTLSSADAGRR